MESSVPNQLNNILIEKLNKPINVIVLHGASASGKSTLARLLMQMFSKVTTVMIINMDSFFKTKNAQPGGALDFESPATINWEAAHDVLRAIHDQKEYIPQYTYDFETQKSEKLPEIRNSKPKILIVEGIYAMNLFSQLCFDVTKYSLYDPIGQEHFAKNTHKYPEFGVLNIKLKICYKRMKQVRIFRDVTERKQIESQVIMQFDQQIWPATEHRVNNKEFHPDVTLIHGSFNKKKIRALLEALSKHFKSNETYEVHGTLSKPDLVSCSRECKPDNNDGIVLEDFE